MEPIAGKDEIGHAGPPSRGGFVGGGSRTSPLRQRTGKEVSSILETTPQPPADAIRRRATFPPVVGEVIPAVSTPS